MTDARFVEFLRWALPRMQLRWPGFRKVRRQVLKRVRRRMTTLQLRDLSEYRARLEAHQDEWEVLDELCRITISRFYRDRGVFDALRATYLPRLQPPLRAWSAGCASGEEPYTLSLIRELDLAVDLEVIATDASPTMLERARAGVYPRGTLKDLPPAWIETAFDRRGNGYRLHPRFRRGITFLEQDIRRQMPDEACQLVLCRNLVLTYFDRELQHQVLEGIAGRMAPGALLVVGSHEHLPDGLTCFSRCQKGLPIFRRTGEVATSPR